MYCFVYSKIVELEEELRVVGNNLKSLEVSEEKVSPRKILLCRKYISVIYLYSKQCYCKCKYCTCICVMFACNKRNNAM